MTVELAVSVTENPLANVGIADDRGLAAEAEDTIVNEQWHKKSGSWTQIA